MMRFTYQYDKDSPKVTMTIKGPDTTLAEVIEQFEGFLKAAGYSFDGQLDFTEEQVKEAVNA